MSRNNHRNKTSKSKPSNSLGTPLQATEPVSPRYPITAATSASLLVSMFAGKQEEAPHTKPRDKTIKSAYPHMQQLFFTASPIDKLRENLFALIAKP